MISEKMKCIVYSIKKELDNKMRQYNLTAVQFMILGYLYDNKDTEIIQKDICNHLTLKHSTVINILKRLEQKGLIIKNTNRKAIISITDKGIKLLNTIGIKGGYVEEKLLEGITEKERKNLSIQLDKMYKNIKDNI